MEVSCRFKCKDSSQWFWEDFQCVSFFFSPGSGSTYIYGHCDATYKHGMTKEECFKFVANGWYWNALGNLFFFFCLPQKLVWWPMALSQGGLVMTDIIETSFKTFQRTFWMVLFKWCWLLVHIDPYDLWPWDLCRNQVSIRGVRELFV